jgi:outer membrane protein assembly factor BamB
MSRLRPVGFVLGSVVALVAFVANAVNATTDPPKPIDWPTDGYGPARSGFNPNENALTPTTVPGLHLRWSADLGGAMIAQPIVAANVLVGGERRTVVFEGTEDGILDAVDASDGEVLWQDDLGSVVTTCQDIPGGVFGIGGAVTIDRPRGTLYAVGDDGAVHAFGLASGLERPHWPITGVFDPEQIHDYGGLTLDLGTGRLYVTFAGHCDQRPYHGQIVEVDVATRAVRRFFPSGPYISGGGIWGPGGVSVDIATHHVFAATGNAKHDPEDIRYSNAVVELTSSLTPLGADHPPLTGLDTDFGSTPLLFRPAGCPGLAAAMNKTGSLFLYERGALDDGPLQRLQISEDRSGHFQGMPAWSTRTGMVYLTDNGDSPDGVYHPGIVALRVATGCTVELAWERRFGIGTYAVPPPTVAGDVVYATDGLGNEVRAWVAATGRLLWSSGDQIGGAALAGITVVDGMVLVPAWDGELYCFSL